MLSCYKVSRFWRSVQNITKTRTFGKIKIVSFLLRYRGTIECVNTVGMFSEVIKIPGEIIAMRKTPAIQI